MQKYLILSYGRAGSLLLAHNIGKKIGSMPVYFSDNYKPVYFNDSDSFNYSRVIHCHELLPVTQFTNYTRIFILRQHPIDTILSMIIANFMNTENNNQYHQLTTESTNQIISFRYQNWVNITRICQCLWKWHDHYSKTLKSSDVVIIYEDMISKLEEFDYKPTYPNKSNILINYDEIVDYINTCWNDIMLDSCRKMLQHQNESDLYKIML